MSDGTATVSMTAKESSARTILAIDLGKFKSQYPGWDLRWDVPRILKDIFEANVERWQVEVHG